MHITARSTALAFVLLVLLLALGAAAYLALPPVTHTGTDIYYSFIEGQRIVAGVNPYTRILSGNMRDNQKYPTYFPLFFLIAAGMQRLGLVDYQAWFATLHWVLLPFNLGAGALLYFMLYKRKGLALAVLGLVMWLLNRWNLQIAPVSNIDNVAIFFMLLSLWLLDRHRVASLLLLSLALAFKHFGLFVVPLYLIVIWHDTTLEHPQASTGQKLRPTLSAALIIASIPFLLSLPFVVWPGDTLGHNVMGLARSIFFSATRNAAAHVEAPSFDSLFGLTGFPARLPMFGLFLLVYLAYGQGRIKLYAACLLVFAILIDFNSVLFLQYFCWLVPFGLLTVAEMDLQRRPMARATEPASSVPNSVPSAAGWSTNDRSQDITA
jgi:hypothetical protein